MDKKLSLGLVSLTVIFTLSFLGCAANSTTKTVKSTPPPVGATSSSSSSDTTTSTDETKNDTDTASTFKYDLASIESATKIELNTPWETSPLGKFTATIEGKGEKANAEGYSHIIIKDIASNKLTKLTFENEEKNKLTARDLEWIDDTNLFVILGQPFGTVSKGGSIYKVNTSSGETTLYLKTSNAKEEFTTVHKTGNVFTFEKYVYEDDNFIKGHAANGTIDMK